MRWHQLPHIPFKVEITPQMHFKRDSRVLRARLRLFSAALATAVMGSGFSDVVTISAAPVPAVNLSIEVKASGGRFDDGGRLAAFNIRSWAPSEVARINPDVFELALSAAQCATASDAVDDPRTLTIIDYSKPSIAPRLWVLDLRSRELVYEELVSHGQGSGGNFATRFSNTPDSHQTSIGLFVTDTTYVGRNGYSLRLDGLDHGFNDRARERAIVIHGAPYVNEEITKSLGRLGRSHGCPAVRESVARELIDRVKGGGLVFAYYPDAEWLEGSRFLGGCGN